MTEEVTNISGWSPFIEWKLVSNPQSDLSGKEKSGIGDKRQLNRKVSTKHGPKEKLLNLDRNNNGSKSAFIIDEEGNVLKSSKLSLYKNLRGNIFQNIKNSNLSDIDDSLLFMQYGNIATEIEILGKLSKLKDNKLDDEITGVMKFIENDISD